MVRDAFNVWAVGGGDVCGAASAGRVTVRVYVSVLGEGGEGGRGVRTFPPDAHAAFAPRRRGGRPA